VVTGGVARKTFRFTPSGRLASTALMTDSGVVPGAIRTDHHGQPPRPTALKDPSHHTRATRSDTPGIM